MAITRPDLVADKRLRVTLMHEKAKAVNVMSTAEYLLVMDYGKIIMIKDDEGCFLALRDFYAITDEEIAIVEKAKPYNRHRDRKERKREQSAKNK